MQKRKNGGKQFVVVHKQIREMKKKTKSIQKIIHSK